MERYSKIQSTGSYIPEGVRTNDDLVKMLGSDETKGGTSDKWIQQRIGMKERRITQHEYETHQYMVEKAIDDCLQGRNVADSVLIVAGNTHEHCKIPCTASQIQDDLELNMTRGYSCNPPAYDIVCEARDVIRKIHTYSDCPLIVDDSSYIILPKEGMSTSASDEACLKKLIRATPDDFERIDSIIKLTRTESLAEKIARNYGFKAGFDITTGCASWNYGLALADAMIKAGETRVVVAAVDKLLDIVDARDRNSVVLFGELAAATLIEHSEKPGFIYHELQTEGDKHSVIKLDEKGHFWQDGSVVYNWALNVLMNSGIAAAEKSHEEDREHIRIAHQANPRMLRTANNFISRKLKTEKPELLETWKKQNTVITGDLHGNSSTASPGTALDHAYKTLDITEGTLVEFVAFGAGLSKAINWHIY